MRIRVLLAVMLFIGLGVVCHAQSSPLASPYSNSVFPAQVFTASGKTGTAIQLNGLMVPSTIGSSFASGAITLTGTSLTTATFGVQGSSDNGATYFPLPIVTVATPTASPTLTVTATANGMYLIGLAGITHVRFVTSGTFTGTSVSLTLTASPNAQVSRNNGGGGGGGFPPAGNTGDIQFNCAGALCADSGDLTYIPGSHTLVTLNQILNGTLSQSVGDKQITTLIDSFHTGPTDSLGNSLDMGIMLTPRSWGVGKNVGNPFGGNSAEGWRTLIGLDIESFAGSSGIHQGLHINPFHFGSGDTAGSYIGRGGGFSHSMWTDASGEGTTGLNINTTQFACIATGTVSATTGTGDRNPTFNITPVNCDGAGQLISDGIIIDTSVTLLHTNLTGTVSSVWETNPYLMGNLPVTAGTAVLSTGIGILIADIPLSTVPGQYQTQTFSAGIHDNLALTTGPVFVATAGGPEQCNILTVTPGPSTPQTGTISCAKFHPTGSYIFQGGTQGFGDFDDDLAQMNLHSVVYVLGATDTSHVIIAHRQAGGFLGQNLPYRGAQPAGKTVNGGFTVHPGALCVTTNLSNTSCTLEFNTVAWAAGHTFASPTGIPTLENVITASSSQSSPDSPQSAGSGISLTFNNNTQHMSFHPFLSLLNAAPLAHYVDSGPGTGWLSPPPAMRVNGPMGNLAEFDMALPDTLFGTTACGGATLLCYKNSRQDLASFNLLADGQNSEKIVLDGVNSRFRFIGWGISAPVAEFGAATVNSKQICLADGTNCPASTGISALMGDCSASGSGSVSIICTKTNGVAFAPSATVDTTNAANIGSGVLSAQRGGTGVGSLPNGLLAGRGGTNPIGQAAITDITSTLGYTPALGPNFTNDFTACYTFTEASTATLLDRCGTNNGAPGTNKPVATGHSWQFSPNGATSPVVLPSTLNNTKTWYFALSIPPAQAGGFASSQVNTILGNTVGGFTQLDINASNSISVTQTFGSFNSFENGFTTMQIDNVFNGPAILTLVCTAGVPDVVYFNGVQAINTQAGSGTSACGHMPSGSFEIGGSADSGNFTAFAEFYDIRMSNNAHTAAQVAQNVSALINEMNSRGVTLFPQIKYVYPVQQLFFAGDSITCGFLAGGSPSCTQQANPYVNGTNSSTAYENNLTLEQSFGIQGFGTPAAMIEQQASAASVLYAPLCYTQKGQSIASIFEGTNNVTAGESAATTWAYAAGWTKLMHSFGCKTVFISMISRGQPTTTAENFKIAYTAIARANWKQAGFDAFVDMESDPFMGCFQCYNNATYFNTGDLTHPTPAGHLKIAAAVSATINYLSNGSTPTNPNPVIVTAATYTSSFDDGGLVFDTTANNIVDTLTTAQWQTGRQIARCNNTASGSHTLTITAPSDFPFNNVSGSTTVTVANGTCKTFQSSYIAGTPNGDYWRVVN